MQQNCEFLGCYLFTTLETGMNFGWPIVSRTTTKDERRLGCFHANPSDQQLNKQAKKFSDACSFILRWMQRSQAFMSVSMRCTRSSRISGLSWLTCTQEFVEINTSSHCAGSANGAAVGDTLNATSKFRWVCFNEKPAWLVCYPVLELHLWTFVFWTAYLCPNLSVVLRIMTPPPVSVAFFVIFRSTMAQAWYSHDLNRTWICMKRLKTLPAWV